MRYFDIKTPVRQRKKYPRLRTPLARYHDIQPPRRDNEVTIAGVTFSFLPSPVQALTVHAGNVNQTMNQAIEALNRSSKPRLSL